MRIHVSKELCIARSVSGAPPEGGAGRGGGKVEGVAEHWRVSRGLLFAGLYASSSAFLCVARGPRRSGGRERPLWLGGRESRGRGGRGERGGSSRVLDGRHCPPHTVARPLDCPDLPTARPSLATHCHGRELLIILSDGSGDAGRHRPASIIGQPRISRRAHAWTTPPPHQEWCSFLAL